MAKHSKYGNVKITYLGLKFDSKLELQRWLFLKECEEKMRIVNLSRQERVTLSVGGEKICDYIADFSYDLEPEGTAIFEDVKGVVTPIFRIKAKLFQALYGHKIKIVKKENITTL